MVCVASNVLQIYKILLGLLLLLGLGPNPMGPDPDIRSEHVGVLRLTAASALLV